jgi:hypothetical protein
MNTLERIISKVFSGRWILTLIAGISLLIITCVSCYASLCGIPPIADPGALLSVIVMVFMSYFQKSTDQANANSENK